ncbi:MAG: disulfide bond formation protein DsbD [Alphaproteobacteria bacterium CG_4_9_14_3_um_filter_47_13]|nr:MAG: disulfide bond formation protein DsbD [Alphaproteobacteria bacterium CG_4_9_14_3_um_filter_47_13]
MRTRSPNFLFIMIMVIGVCFSYPALAQDNSEPSHVSLSLIPEFSEVESGATIYIAIEQNIGEGWHTYWRNAGDSGQPPRITWHLPEGFETGALLWPIPKRLPMGPLTNYGYEGTVTLLQELRIPFSLPEKSIEIKADIDILVCKEICISEFHEASFILNDGIKTDHTQIITTAFEHMPVDVDWPAQYSIDEEGKFVIDLKVEMPSLITNGGERIKFDVLPYEWGIIDNNSSTQIWAAERFLRLVFRKERGDRPLEKLGEITALITYKNMDNDARGALEIKAQPDEIWLAKALEKSTVDTTTLTPEETIQTQKPSHLSSISFIQALFFAFLGGIILNLMPCVFPVLSIKALSLVQMAEKSHIATRLHGLAYMGGVLVSFGVLAGLLIVLQNAGARIGWGFQLQNPLVVLSLASLLFLIGLNLSGFYEIRGSFTNVGAGLGRKEGTGESFLTGILATIVATPCTAPFMGAAMGYALLQPPAISLLVFLTLGFGLGLPYLMLAFFPAFRKFLPKSGHWMILFREFLAFPLYASAGWMLWIYSQQTTEPGLLYALFGFVGIGLAIWVFRSTERKGNPGKLLLRSLAILCLLVFFIMAAAESLKENAHALTQEKSPESAYWQVFTPERFATAETGTQPLFVNMTASWCITCKINEKITLDTVQVKETFKTQNILYFKGDWTNQDSAITDFLQSYGRNGVPLYVYYGARDQQTGQRPEPVILPQMLTPKILISVIQNEQ